MGFLAANPSLVRWWKIRKKKRENNHVEKFSRKRINRVFQLLQKGIYSILCKLEWLLKLQVQEVTFIYTLQKGKQGRLRILRLLASNYTNFKPNYFTAFLFNSSFKYVPFTSKWFHLHSYSTKTFTQKNLRVIKPREFLVII